MRTSLARQIPAVMATALSLLLRALILVYRFGLSPVLGPHCRFTPTCSAYADEAIRRHGPLRGGWLALRRVARCHPWGDTGYDPVPAPRRSDAATPAAPLPAPNARS